MPSNPNLDLLLAAMRELEAHLTGRDAFWADRVRRAADEVSRSDAHGLELFLSYFGGMGSLNDLVLHGDGQPLGAENTQVDGLRRRAWSLAQDLKHGTDR